MGQIFEDEKSSYWKKVKDSSTETSKKTHLWLGDFNLSWYCENSNTYSGGAFEKLKSCGFEPLLKKGVTTNHLENGSCYDNMLLYQEQPSPTSPGANAYSPEAHAYDPFEGEKKEFDEFLEPIREKTQLQYFFEYFLDSIKKDQGGAAAQGGGSKVGGVDGMIEFESDHKAPSP